MKGRGNEGGIVGGGGGGGGVGAGAGLQDEVENIRRKQGESNENRDDENIWDV